MINTGKKLGGIALAACLSVGLFFAPSQAKDKGGKEHAGKEHAGKEHAGKEHDGKAVKISAKDIKEKINHYIKKDTGLKGGSFLIYDDKLEKTWRLKFVKIHDPVRIINKKTYFACMDFKEVGGSDVLDIDFWLETKSHAKHKAKHKDKHKLKITEIKIHKLNGTPRFTYKDDKPVPVK